MTASTGKYRLRGTGSIRFGYLLHTNKGIQKFAHVLIAERVLEKPLPPKAVVHHPDENRLNNNNLVICQDAAYHRMIHRRMVAFKVSGHANWRKCWICKTYDNPDRLYISPNGMNIHHKSCNDARKERKNHERSNESV